jgi:hypothetical protein
MQAELNKYFPTDVSNLILEMHYKSMFNDCLSFMIFVAENETCLLSGYDIDEDEDFQKLEIDNFREALFRRYKYRVRKYIESPDITDTDSDSE